jgi:hypothetical protein
MAKTENRLPNAVLEDVRFLFPNFAGREERFNREGNRNVSIALEPDVAQAMERDGWNIKYLKPRENDEEDAPLQAYIKVAVSYRIRAPKIYMITSRGKTPLGEGEISMLDWVDITHVDVILNPSYWDVDGNKGIKAYLQSAYITIEEDELDLKYGDVPTSGGGQGAPHFEGDN